MREKEEEYKIKISQIWENLDNEELEKGEALCKAMSADYPDKGEVYYLLGHFSLKNRLYKEAIDRFNIALTKDCGNKGKALINYWIGKIYKDYSCPFYDKEKAKEYYLKAKNIDGYPIDVIFELEGLLTDHDQRLKLYQEAKQYFPDNIYLCIQLAREYDFISKTDEGIKVLLNAINEGFQSVSLYYNIGYLFFNLQKYSISREYLKKSLSFNNQNNNNFLINYEIGNTFYMEGNFSEAEKFYFESFKNSGEQGKCWLGFLGVCDTYRKSQQSEVIMNVIRNFTISKKNFCDIDFGTDPFWLDSKNWEFTHILYDYKFVYSSLKSIKTVIKDNFILSKYFLIMSVVDKNMNKDVEGIRLLKKAFNGLSIYEHEYLLEELSSFYVKIIETKLLRHQNIDKIINELIEDLEKYPISFKKSFIEFNISYERKLDYIIELLFKQKEYFYITKIGEEFDDKLLKDSDILFELAYSYNEQGNSKKAKLLYEELIKQKGEDSASLNNLANIVKLEGDLQSAIVMYKRAIELDPNDSISKNNLEKTMKLFKEKELEIQENLILTKSFKEAINTLKFENNFVRDKLLNFIYSVKKDPCFSDWCLPIQKYKFAKYIGTDEQKAMSLREQWIKKNYIIETEQRDQYNVPIYKINPFIEAKIIKINNSKIPENWIYGFSEITIDKLDEIHYFDLVNKISKINKKFRTLILRDYNELVFNFFVRNEKATIVLSGSLIELCLIYYFEKKKYKEIFYRDQNERIKKKFLYECVLFDLISFAEENKFLGSDFHPLSNLSRIYRNFIHPGKELKEKIEWSKCQLCFISTIEILKKIL